MIGLLSRIYPDANTPEALAALQKHGASVGKNFPSLILEMQASRNQERRALGNARVAAVAAGILNIGGPLARAHLEKFGAKFAFAMHYHETGERVPDGGAVSSRYFTNMSVLDETFPADALAYFGEPKTLVQGAKHVGDQFQYNSAKVEGGSVAFAALRKSFMFFTVSADDASKLDTVEEAGERLLRSGSMKERIAPEFPRQKWIWENSGYRWGWHRRGATGPTDG